MVNAVKERKMGKCAAEYCVGFRLCCLHEKQHRLQLNWILGNRGRN